MEAMYTGQHTGPYARPHPLSGDASAASAGSIAGSYTGSQAMFHRGDDRRRLAHLWQLPLLILSIGLFACAAFLYVDARPGITLSQKLSTARTLLHNDRPDAAVEAINRLVAAERLPRESEAQVHLLLAESLDAAQKQRKQNVAANYVRIIEQTQIAMAQGVRPTGDILRRLGESYEALGKPVEAVSQYRQAIAIDPSRALRLQRKVIDLQLASSDWAPAEASLDAYLASKDISDAERAWAQTGKAQLLIDRGEYVDARRLLDASMRLDADPIAQAEMKYRLGVCAWKLGSGEEATRLIRAARGEFKGQHPLDADAAYTLGRIALEKNDSAGAIALFDSVLKNFADSPIAPLARLARGSCKITKGGDDESAVADLKAATEAVKTNAALRDETLAALQKASAAMSARGNEQAGIDLLLCEQSIDANPPGGFYSRLATAYEKRGEQIEQSIADATAVEKVRRTEMAREYYDKAAVANLAYSKALSVSGDKGYGEPMWKAIDLYDRAGNPNSIVAALELFVTERADDAIAPDAMLRLARTYESSAQTEKAISAYGRLRGGYPKSPSALKAALPMALLLEKSPDSLPLSKRVLAEVVDDASANRGSDDYRQALFELGAVSFRTGDLKESASRLEAFTSRFPQSEKLAEATFLLGECYRGTAQQADVQLASANESSDERSAAKEMEQRASAKKNQLSRAAGLYDRCAELYRATPPTQDADRRYQKLAALRRADCEYEMGKYGDAVGLYQAVAGRWPDEPVALAAWVQIVNSNCAMNKLKDAKAANEQARQLLAKMPQGAFTESGTPAGGMVMPKAYWEQWLKSTGAASASTW